MKAGCKEIFMHKSQLKATLCHFYEPFLLSITQVKGRHISAAVYIHVYTCIWTICLTHKICLCGFIHKSPPN